MIWYTAPLSRPKQLSFVIVCGWLCFSFTHFLPYLENHCFRINCIYESLIGYKKHALLLSSYVTYELVIWMMQFWMRYCSCDRISGAIQETSRLDSNFSVFLKLSVNKTGKSNPFCCIPTWVNYSVMNCEELRYCKLSIFLSSVAADKNHCVISLNSFEDEKSPVVSCMKRENSIQILCS